MVDGSGFVQLRMTAGGGDGVDTRAGRTSITFRGRTVSVPLTRSWTSLRAVLLRAGLTPHNGRARWINCRGLGTCGTCAVEVVAGKVQPADRTRVEELRLSFPPHKPLNNLRLCCQVTAVPGTTLVLRKYAGMWGHQLERESIDAADLAVLPFGEVEFVVDRVKGRMADRAAGRADARSDSDR